jgi:TonB-linked SusC/RagA family outer membrane protein
MIFRVMASLLLPVLASLSCYSQAVPPPEKICSLKVQFTETTLSLEETLENTKKQTKLGYIFQGATDEFRKTLVPLPQKATCLDSFLTAILTPHSLYFTINNNIIVIKEKEDFSMDPAKGPLLSFTITGTVEDEKGKFLAKASIEVKDSSRRGTQSDTNGQFQLKNVSKGAVLIISYNGMKPVEKRIEDADTVKVRLVTNIMEDVVVESLSNGYQHLPKENTISSIDFIPRELLERRITTNILDRLPYSGPGILFNLGGQADDGTSTPDPIQIRGRSTLLANAAPLIVIDNFPYDGDARNINPNDIESVSILKDATATSIWGARAGNGVIVMVSKKSNSIVPQFVYQSNIGIEQRPEIFNTHPISSPDYLDFEKYLFDQGYYDANYADPQNFTAVSPGVDLLHAEKMGLISHAEAEARRTVLKKQDVRNDISKYLYRTSLNQQHSLQVSAGAGANRYFFSAGWDHNLSSLAATQYDRITLRSQNSFQLSPRLQIEAGINFTQTNNRNGDNIQYNFQSPLLHSYIYPYAHIADAQGHALPLNLDYNSNYLQQTRGLGFPNWDLKPLSELYAETNKIRIRDFLLTTGIRYAIFGSLNLDIKYQFEDQATTGKDLHSDSSYYTRDLINSLIQVDPVTHTLRYIVPMGGILDMSTQEMISHQGRIQLNYNRHWGKSQVLEAIVGYETRSVETTGNSNRYYGYDPNGNLINPGIDYAGSYTQYLIYASRNVPNPQSISKLTDHFISYYANASYWYRRRYRLYASIRKDEANLFGVSTNEKGVPLWSAGMGWQANKEKWYILKWLPVLNLKATYGISGNIARLANASTTATSFPGGVSGSPYPMLIIKSPPNKMLRWEQVQQINFGIDFDTRKDILSGTISYYQKHAKDLLAETAADPTLGLVQTPGTPGIFYGNTAEVNGKGVDLEIETHNLNRKFKWTTNFLFNYSASKVEKYLNPAGPGNLYLSQNTLNPIKGRPVFSVFSFKTAGLDPQTGDPRGIIKGIPSTDYDSIYNYTVPDSLNFNGPTQPVFFGSLRNSFSLGAFSFSFMLSYRLGHYFRQPSINYYQLALTRKGNSDYAKRWQHPGDEKTTNVPSLHDIFDGLRDDVYLNSTPLVKKADEIRWEDITIGYDLDKTPKNRLPFQHIHLYGTIAGLGVIWAANKQGIDPNYINVPKERPRYSLGLTLNFSPLNHRK